jgi:hydroxymethylpyrimidine pyrophosphatase-like HAD family hydrolase/hypoxanthine phosphoribosyltransferase
LPVAGLQWQRSEIRTNIYLLGCALSDTLDDYLLGSGYDFPKGTATVPGAGLVRRGFERMAEARKKIRTRWLKQLCDWREDWETALVDLLKLFISESGLDAEMLLAHEDLLPTLLEAEFPGELRARRIRVPAAFRSQDLTPYDALTLGQKFSTGFPNRKQPVLIAGLRTAGSYFAPLLRAFLENENYENVACVTLREKTGISSRERKRLEECVERNSLVVVVDEPANTGSTICMAIEELLGAGIERNRIAVLVPVHPNGREWKNSYESFALYGVSLFTLEPEEWHKRRWLDAQAQEHIREYFEARQYSVRGVGVSQRAEEFNRGLGNLSEEKFHDRLKRVYEVHLRDEAGNSGTRFVLAKSVGWGWFSYHAFLAGERLAEFVPPLVGLRDGILYTEWRPGNGAPAKTEADRERWLETAGSYVARRVKTLPLGSDPTPALRREDRHQGTEDLVTNLSRAYGSKPAAALKRARIRLALARQQCSVPTLIDCKMRPIEWVQDSDAVLKTDYEHHGLGKTEINIVDPVYDIAEASLGWSLSPAEEQVLLSRYVEESGDTGAAERLFLNKLVAGIRALNSATANLEDHRVAKRSQEFNRDYINAWTFLVVHTMRRCASFSRKPESLWWRDPLVAMDIDGVLDRQIFGFPSTTLAGMRAVSLLQAHGFAIAVNTARSIPEVKAYCRAYGFVGGVAELGAYVWDVVTGQEQVLVTPESLSQLAMLKDHLRQIPGVFLNDNFCYSIRAYTYERGATVALPKLLIQNLLADLKLDRLTCHQTFLDTAIVATETDKGRGLLGLLQVANQPTLSILAIGDSEADLPMFAVASKSFAPSQMSSPKVAKALGCTIVDRDYQPGLLRIARLLAHPDGGHCEHCKEAELSLPKGDDLFLRLLGVADKNPAKLLLGALLDPEALGVFKK